MKIGDRLIWVLPSGEYRVKISGEPIGPGGSGFTVGIPGGGEDVHRLRYDGPFYPVEITEGNYEGRQFTADARELRLLPLGE